MKQHDIEIRTLSSEDDLNEITELLHLAYKPLADQGLKFWATWQSVSDTKKRFAKGHGYVALSQGKVVGTITFGDPFANDSCDWLNRSDVAVFYQFAVTPKYQQAGLGAKMLEHVEKAASEQGYKYLVCDTAESACKLIEYYENKGFEIIDKVQWGHTNYQSVVLSKPLL